MSIQVYSLSKKYATAYLNLYFHNLTDKIMGKLTKLKNCLQKDKNFCLYLSMPNVTLDAKIKFANQLCKYFRLSKNEKLFIITLIKKHRTTLIIPSIERIIEGYKLRKGFISLDVYTSHKTNNKQKLIIKKFTKNLIKKNVLINYSIDKSLINGIKIQNPTLLWERSIKKCLKLLESDLQQQALL